MKKILSIVAIIYILILTTVFVSADTDPNVYIKGEPQIRVVNSYYTMKNGIIESNDIMYVPIRELGEKMGIPVEWDEEKMVASINPNYKKINVFTNNPDIETENICAVPDEETAYQIGKLILENALGQEVVFETENLKSDLEVSFIDEGLNCWSVWQKVYYNGKRYRRGNAANCVYINKNTAEIQKMVLTLPLPDISQD